MCRYEYTTCALCTLVVSTVDEQCHLMKDFFNCENGRAFQPPLIKEVTCFTCIRLRMDWIWRGIEGRTQQGAEDAKSFIACEEGGGGGSSVESWLNDVVSSPGGTTGSWTTDSTAEGSVAMSPG